MWSFFILRCLESFHVEAMKVNTLQGLFILQILVAHCFGVKKYVLEVGMGFKSPDCVEKAVILINGQFPGPAIRATPSMLIEIKVCSFTYYDISEILL